MITQPTTPTDPAPFTGAVITNGRWAASVPDVAEWLTTALKREVTYSEIRGCLNRDEIRIYFRTIDAEDALAAIQKRRRRWSRKLIAIGENKK